MKTVKGTYYNGKLTLDEPLETDRPIKVTVIVEEENQSEFKLSDFSFEESQEMLKDVKTSFSEEVVEERRKAL